MNPDLNDSDKFNPIMQSRLQEAPLQLGQIDQL